MSFFLLMIYFFGLVNNEKLNSIIYIVFIVGVYFSVKNYRDQVMGGYLNFGPAFSTGFLTCLFIGLVGAVYTYFQYKYMSPALLDDMILQMQDNMINRGMSDEQIEMQSVIFEQFMSPGVMSLGIIFGSAFWGALLSLIFAGILKKQDNPLLTNQD